MKFVIDNTSGRMTTNGVTATIDTSALATNINYVFFSDENGGNIIYNDRAAIPEPFSDPSPYQPYFDAWITAVAAQSPALNLTQAITAKQGLVSSIYEFKRQQPVNVTVTAGNYNFDASDEAVGRLSVYTGFIFVDAVNATIAAGVNAIVNELNNVLVPDFNNNMNRGEGNFGQINTNAAYFNDLNSNFSVLGGGIQNSLNVFVNNIHTAMANAEVYDAGNDPPEASGGVHAYLAALPGVAAPGTPAAPGASGMPYALYDTTATFATITLGGSYSAPTMQLIPVGGTSVVNLSSTDVGTIARAIIAQYERFQSDLLTIQAAINALASVSAVAAYDVTTGWT